MKRGGLSWISILWFIATLLLCLLCYILCGSYSGGVRARLQFRALNIPFVNTADASMLAASSEQEPNDNASEAQSATFVSVGASNGDIEGELGLGDEDWFALDGELLGNGAWTGHFHAYATGDGDPEIEVYADDGSGLVLQATGSDNPPGDYSDLATLSLDPTLDYYVRVYASTAITTPYTFRAEAEEVPDGDDAYEPNDDTSHATLITAEAPDTAQGYDAHLGGDDVDFWQFNVENGWTYDITVERRSGGDPALELYAVTETGLVLVASNDNCAPGSYSPCVRYTVHEDVAASGTMYVRVVNNTPELDVAYTLYVTTDSAGTPEPGPGADIYEPNDSAYNATTIQIDESIAASLDADGDVDWFRVYLDGGGRCYEVEVGGPPVAYFHAGSPDNFSETYALADDGAGSTTQSLVYCANSSAFYYIEVRQRYAYQSTGYSLIVTRYIPDPTPIPTTPPETTPTPTPTPLGGDIYEPNDSAMDATFLYPGQRLSGVIDPVSDLDYYVINTTSGIEYNCTLETEGFGALLTLYDAGMSVLTENRDTVNGWDGVVTWRAVGATYYLSVMSLSSVGGSYSILCEAERPTPTPTPLPTTPTPTPTPYVIPTPTPYETPTPLGGTAAGDYNVGGDYGGGGHPLPSVAADTKLASAPVIRVVVYYDGNQNDAPDPQEGVRGIHVILRDASNNSLLSITQTNNDGAATVEVGGDVTVIDGERIYVSLGIPYLGYKEDYTFTWDEETQTWQSAYGSKPFNEVKVAGMPLPAMLP